MTEYNQKRREFRIHSSYAFLYRKLQGEKPDGSHKWHKTMTLNLSAGGAALFAEDEKLAPGDLLEFQLVIPGGPVFGIAEVVRILDSQGLSDAVGVSFVSMAPRDKDKIARVVLTDGLENRHGKHKKD